MNSVSPRPWCPLIVPPTETNCPRIVTAPSIAEISWKIGPQYARATQPTITDLGGRLKVRDRGKIKGKECIMSHVFIFVDVFGYKGFHGSNERSYRGGTILEEKYLEHNTNTRFHTIRRRVKKFSNTNQHLTPTPLHLIQHFTSYSVKRSDNILFVCNLHFSSISMTFVLKLFVLHNCYRNDIMSGHRKA